MTDEYTGWLLDVYADLEGGISLWLLPDDSKERLHLRMAFPITFYAAGDFSLLRRRRDAVSGAVSLNVSCA